jgi:hypothetical protein
MIEQDEVFLGIILLIYQIKLLILLMNSMILEILNELDLKIKFEIFLKKPKEKMVIEMQV